MKPSGRLNRLTPPLDQQWRLSGSDSAELNLVQLGCNRYDMHRRICKDESVIFPRSMERTTLTCWACLSGRRAQTDNSIECNVSVLHDCKGCL